MVDSLTRLFFFISPMRHSPGIRTVSPFPLQAQESASRVAWNFLLRRPELRPGSERDKITAAAPPTDLSLRETPWLEFERRRKERAERRKAMRIKTEEERAVEAMAEITRSARGNHGQGQGTAVSDWARSRWISPRKGSVAGCP